jgi:hypothetical protein
MAECVIVDCEADRAMANYCMSCYRTYVLGDVEGGAAP